MSFDDMIVERDCLALNAAVTFLLLTRQIFYPNLDNFITISAGKVLSLVETFQQTPNGLFLSICDD